MNFKNGFILILFCVSTFLNAQETEDSTNTYKSLYNARIDLTTGTETWAKNITDIVFDETISEDEKTSQFYFLKQENTLLVNPKIPFKSHKVTKEEALIICKTLKKICRSEKCVTSTLIAILGDGDRNVLIKYERKLLSV
jgi:hypothetical protein